LDDEAADGELVGDCDGDGLEACKMNLLNPLGFPFKRFTSIILFVFNELTDILGS
jgi:hypothetical protein